LRKYSAAPIVEAAFSVDATRIRVDRLGSSPACSIAAAMRSVRTMASPEAASA